MNLPISRFVGVRLRYIVCLAAGLALALPAAASALPSLTANPANKLLSRGIDPIHYDPATRCNGGKIPAGTKAMVAWLERNAAGVNWGEYRCEMWGKHEASLHSAGRAIDWHPTTMSDGHALVKLLLAPDKDGNAAALARRMGVQGIIFNCQAWFGGWDGQLGNYSYCYDKNGKRKKNLDPTQAHMNHVHIELNLRGAAKKTTFWDKNISYDTPTPAPVSTPAPQAPAQPAPQQQPQTHPWNGPGGGTQYDQTGGAWN
jgi:hypothetical protein